MKMLETKIDVPADPHEVWDVLMDFASYGSWNPMVVAIAGGTNVGDRLRITVAMGDGRRMSFRPVVVEREPGRRFAWLGKLWVRGVFDGLHRFEVVPRAGGSTFIHSEEFRGLLPVLVPKLLRDVHSTLEAMNDALVQEVARRSGVASQRLQPAIVDRQ